MRSLFAALLLAVPLTACQAQDNNEPTAASPSAAETAPKSEPVTVQSGPATTPPTLDATPDADACGSAKLGRWLNVLPTETAKDAILTAVGERPIRYYTQGDPVTMDFNPARLNVELGKDGRIKLFRCG